MTLSSSSLTPCSRAHASFQLPNNLEASSPYMLLLAQDQRSTNIAVDNLSGATVAGRVVRVQHVKNYKKQKAEVCFSVTRVEPIHYT